MKTARDNNSDSPPSANKCRKSSASDDLVCPITHELPFDPVTAEDGRLYERSAIEEHFEKHTGELKSPFTNEIMGQRLFPLPQIKNLIKTLIESRVITGDLADNWKKTGIEKEEMEDLLKDAEGGDTVAMNIVSRYYRRGKNGFKKNAKLACKWAEKAHSAGNVKGTAKLGRLLIFGEGVEKNVVQGMVLTTMAAERGSNVAAYHLGCAFGKGQFGLSFDIEQAILWLQRCLSDDCRHKHLNETGKEKAHILLQELMNGPY